MAGDGKVFLLERDRFAGSHAQLPFDQVDPGDFLGHRMLDLKAGVHFHEEDAVGAQPFAGVGDELDRARAFVIDRLGGAHGSGADFLTRRLVHARRRGFLDHLLVAALEAAIALEQVDDIAVAVAEHLHLDMAGRGDPLFQQHFVIGEAGLRLAAATLQIRFEIFGLVDLAHALAAAARDRLDQHGVADGVGFLLQPFGRLVCAQIAGRNRDARFHHQRLGSILEPHRLDARRLGTHPDQPGINHGLRETGIFGQEAVARVDGFRPSLLGRSDDLFADKIAFGGG